MPGDNYIRIQHRPPWRRNYAYFDIPGYAADASFKMRKGTPFQSLIGKLRNKILLFGYADYEEFCRMVAEGKSIIRNAPTETPKPGQNQGRI